MRKVFEIKVKSIGGEVRFLAIAEEITIKGSQVCIDDKPLEFLWAESIISKPIREANF